LLWAIFGFLIFMFYKASSQLDLDTSKKPLKAITFDNVVGLEECKESLQEVIDYMKDPKRYEDIGARMRRGIIFYGPSGTGKTTLAKATAG
jgi:cell division protease FtsH